MSKYPALSSKGGGTGHVPPPPLIPFPDLFPQIKHLLLQIWWIYQIIYDIICLIICRVRFHYDNLQYVNHITWLFLRPYSTLFLHERIILLRVNVLSIKRCFVGYTEILISNTILRLPQSVISKLPTSLLVNHETCITLANWRKAFRTLNVISAYLKIHG